MKTQTHKRWRSDPVVFFESLFDPETGKPFSLFEQQRTFLREAFKRAPDGRLLYPLLIFSAPKKDGKTTLDALAHLYVVLVLGGRFAEGEIFANDQEQAAGRVFQQIVRIVEATPWLKADAKITQTRVEFLSSGATITAKASDFAGAAGGNQNVTSFTELWAYNSERLRRLWDETLPPPTRKIACRIVDTYAGFEGESALLKEIYTQGMTGEQIAPDLYSIPGVILMYWSHESHAPWKSPTWAEEMRRTLRPNAYLRLIENRWVSGESAFVPIEWFDACTDPALYPIATRGHEIGSVYVGVDASVKSDHTAIVAVAFDHETKRVRLVWHRVFRPSRNRPIEFAAVESTLLDLRQLFPVRAVLYDPFQMAASAQRLTARGVPMEEFPQSIQNLTAMGQNLFDLIKARALWAYDDAEIRAGMQHAVAVETSRGWKLAKEKASAKVDVVVALAMAALAAVRDQKGQVPGDAFWLSLDREGQPIGSVGAMGFVSAFDEVEAQAREAERRPWASHFTAGKIDWNF